MNRKQKIMITLIFVLTIITSFCIGTYIAGRTYNINRTQRCHQMILFAIDKAENQDISDSNVMEALISNVYAAYELCDDSVCASLLHDLWNRLIFEEDKYVVRNEALVVEYKEYIANLADRRLNHFQAVDFGGRLCYFNRS